MVLSCTSNGCPLFTRVRYSEEEITGQPGMVVHTYASTQEECDFDASLRYIMSSIHPGIEQQDPVSKKKLLYTFQTTKYHTQIVK
jgi:hypothetical protein